MIAPINPLSYITGIYLRLSDDDRSHGDSSSIQSQRLILENFCQNHGLTIGEVYVDDGWSGSNFERPGFKKMINDCQAKKINLILAKDLSRLGRDYIQVGHYTEIYFPSNDIRFIAVDDGYDTLAPNEMGPIKNMFNDWYARDISRKIKSAFAHKVRQGQFISNMPPYGYIKDPADKHHFIVDPVAGPIVREIFELTLRGASRSQVAKILTERRISIPSVHMKMINHISKGNPPDWEYTWHRDMIANIVSNQSYVGDMVNHKSECISHKTKKTIIFGEDSGQRVIVTNTHEALVNREDFERIKEIRSFYNRTPSGKENLFRGIIFCSECGGRMISGGKGTVDRPTVYYCSNHKKKRGCTHKGTIKYNDIKELAGQKIRELFRSFKNDESIIHELRSRNEKASLQENLQEEKSKIQSRLNVLTKLVKKVYEDHAQEVIDNDNYQILVSEYQAEQHSLKKRLEEVDKRLQTDINQANNINKCRQLLNQFADFETLTSDAVTMLINRIEISPPKYKDFQKIVDIKFYFNYLDETKKTPSKSK